MAGARGYTVGLDAQSLREFLDHQGRAPLTSSRPSGNTLPPDRSNLNTSNYLNADQLVIQGRSGDSKGTLFSLRIDNA